MNVPSAWMKDTELRVLSDVELDEVNGGLAWYTKLLLIAVVVALAA